MLDSETTSTSQETDTRINDAPDTGLDDAPIPYDQDAERKDFIDMQEDARSSASSSSTKRKLDRRLSFGIPNELDNIEPELLITLDPSSLPPTTQRSPLSPITEDAEQLTPIAPPTLPAPRRSARLQCVPGRMYETTHGTPCIPIEPDPKILDAWLVKFPIVGPNNTDPDDIYSIDRKSIRDELGDAHLSDYLMDEATFADLASRQLLPPHSAPAQSYLMDGPMSTANMHDMQSEQANLATSCL